MIDIKKYWGDEELDKYNLVRKYLLNEGDSYGGKPIMDTYITILMLEIIKLLFKKHEKY